MKTLYSIQMDYQRAMNQAAELDRLAAQLRTQADSNFPQVLGSIRNAWKGDNANEYVRKAGQLPAKIKGSARDLTNIASTIRTVAKNTYDAEMRAYELAQERTY